MARRRVTEEDARRLRDTVARSERSPDPGRGRQRQDTQAIQLHVGRITSTTKTEDRYPGTRYNYFANTDNAASPPAGSYVAAETIWIKSRRGETMATGINYDLVLVGVRAADGIAIYAVVNSPEKLKYKGKLDGALAVAGTATMSVWASGADTGINVTVNDWLGRALAAGDKVTAFLDPIDGGWHVDAWLTALLSSYGKATDNQTIAHNTNTAITFSSLNGEVFDNGTYFDFGTNSTRMTFATSGVYLVGYDVDWSSSIGSGGGTKVWFEKNSSGVAILPSVSFWGHVADDPGMPANSAATLMSFAAGDYLELYAWQKNAATNSAPGAFQMWALDPRTIGQGGSLSLGDLSALLAALGGVTQSAP